MIGSNVHVIATLSTIHIMIHSSYHSRKALSALESFIYFVDEFKQKLELSRSLLIIIALEEINNIFSTINSILAISSDRNINSFLLNIKIIKYSNYDYIWQIFLRFP